MTENEIKLIKYSKVDEEPTVNYRMNKIQEPIMDMRGTIGTRYVKVLQRQWIYFYFGEDGKLVKTEMEWRDVLEGEE